MTRTYPGTLVNVFAKITLETKVAVTDEASISILTRRVRRACLLVATLVNIDTFRKVHHQIPVNCLNSLVTISTTTTVAACRVYAVDLIATKALNFLALVKV